MEKGFNFGVSSPYFAFKKPARIDNFDGFPSQSFAISNVGVESLVPVTSLNPNGESFDSSSAPSPFDGSSDPVLRYIKQTLLEENMDDRSHMVPDQSALKATEISLYELLGERSPSVQNLYDNCRSTATSSSSVADNSDPLSVPSDFQFQSTPQSSSLICSGNINSVYDFSGRLAGTSVTEMMHKFFNNEESMLQFKRGVEEANKFLPSASQLNINSRSDSCDAPPTKEASLVAGLKEKYESVQGSSPKSSKGLKNHERDHSDLEEGRSNKQSAVFSEESESDLSEMFDKVLLWPSEVKGNQLIGHESKLGGAINSSLDKQTNVADGEKSRSKNQGRKTEPVDLRTLLILCAEAVSTNDSGTANELLKQIRQNSSPTGDGSQRMAHFFANGLEARMYGAGIGLQNVYTSMASKKLTAVNMLIAYKIHRQAFPFQVLSVLFANEMVMDAAKTASTLHVIDFGILYGFKWPVLIQQLSMRGGGPPKLRITGIELPQYGFRPAERVEETGRLLAKYCKRFKVPFEFNPIASRDWASIPIKDFKIDSNEVVVVHSQYRFSNLHDESVGEDCPRDTIFKLIRKMNPNIFIHTVVNASCNAPFFMTRFKEALFHFSAFFDMFDSTLSADDEERMWFEKEHYGRELMNIIACEGLERVIRHETYKQWHTRTVRAGFSSISGNEYVRRMLCIKLNKWFHKDFVIDKDGDWILQGWKGRIISASSCWVPE